jgi:hypothetical protein
MQLRPEVSRRAVFVWLTSGGFCDAGVVKFGEIDEVFLGFSVRCVLQGFLNRLTYIDRPLDLFSESAPWH